MFLHSHNDLMPFNLIFHFPLIVIKADPELICKPFQVCLSLYRLSRPSIKHICDLGERTLRVQFSRLFFKDIIFFLKGKNILNEFGPVFLDLLNYLVYVFDTIHNFLVLSIDSSHFLLNRSQTRPRRFPFFTPFKSFPPFSPFSSRIRYRCGHHHRCSSWSHCRARRFIIWPFPCRNLWVWYWNILIYSKPLGDHMLVNSWMCQIEP